MRVMVGFVLATAMISAVEPVRGQTYDRRYPVCLQTYGPFGGINCSFASMADCRLLVAGGGSAQCLTRACLQLRRIIAQAR